MNSVEIITLLAAFVAIAVFLFSSAKAFREFGKKDFHSKTHSVSPKKEKHLVP